MECAARALGPAPAAAEGPGVAGAEVEYTPGALGPTPAAAEGPAAATAVGPAVAMSAAEDPTAVERGRWQGEKGPGALAA